MPGWNDVETAKSIHAFFEISGLVFFVLLVLLEVLAHTATERKDFFNILALVSFALAIGSELCAYPYSRRVEQLYSGQIKGLKLKLQQRVITDKQIRDFIFLTERFPKIPIRIAVGIWGGDALGFAYQVRAMLDQAGFKRPFDISNGIELNSDFAVLKNRGFRGDVADVCFCYSTTNGIPFLIESVTGVPRPIVIEADSPDSVYSGIKWCFKAIGFTAENTSDPNMQGPVIFIPQKY